MTKLILNLRISKFHLHITENKKISIVKNNDHWAWLCWPFIYFHQIGKWKTVHDPRKLRAKLFFAWYDCWIGFYYARKTHTLYFFPFFMIGIKFNLEKVFYCQFCEEGIEVIKQAHHTGEGWALGSECSQCGDQIIDDRWPFSDERHLNGNDLEAIGYIIV